MGRGEAFTRVSCCFLSPPFQRISSRLPSSGQLVGPGSAAASCASPRSISGQTGTFRGRGGAHAVDVTGRGGCPRQRSCCRKAASERLLLMGELMATGETGRVGTHGDPGVAKVALAGLGACRVWEREAKRTSSWDGGGGRGTESRKDLREDARRCAVRSGRGCPPSAGRGVQREGSGGTWVRLCVCELGSRSGGAKLRCQGGEKRCCGGCSVLLARSLLRAGGLSIYGDGAGPGWPISTQSGAEWALAGRDAGPGGGWRGWKSNGVSEVSEGARASGNWCAALRAGARRTPPRR